MSTNRITRRNALFALGAAAVPQAQGAPGLLRATRVDHVALAVGDIDKAMLFYRRLFGNDVMKNIRTPRRYLHLVPCYLGIEAATAGQVKRIDHAGIGIESFNPEGIRNSLEKAGLKVRESNAGLFVNDPDGATIQIWADQSWNLNNGAPEAGPKQEALFRPRGMHHLAIQVTDMARALDFYRKLFGEQVPGAGDRPQPTFMAGETRIVLYNPAPDKPAKIDHFSVLVDNFDAPAAVKVLKELGARAELSRQGTLNEFFDPDGIRLQVTFPGQTYGNTTKK
jgi:catechol 2,3-dioxygenase-like lactoylglutathione lyase family enzyme